MFFVFLLKIINAQDINYARKIIDELCSEKYHGRGYSFNGDKKAAKFIANQLNENNVNLVGNSYFQPFNISVNTFPYKIKLSIGDIELKSGTDFMISPASKGFNGDFEIFIIDSTLLNKDYDYVNLLTIDCKNKFVIIDTTGVNNKERKAGVLDLAKINKFEAKGIIIVAKKIMYSVSTIESNFCKIYLTSGAYNKLKLPIKRLEIKCKNKFLENYETQNVIGLISGKSDSLIVFTSHYDHLGTMGPDVFFPGANDNASGVSMNLNLSKYFADIDTLKYSVAFLFFSAEEAGILGSKYFVEHPLFPLSKIQFLINLDLVGTGDDGICIVNGAVLKKEFELFSKINEDEKLVSVVKARGEAANSDHYFFYNAGVKSVFIYTLGGVAEYHNPLDISKTLPLTRYNELFKLLTEFVRLYE